MKKRLIIVLIMQFFCVFASTSMVFALSLVGLMTFISVNDIKTTKYETKPAVELPSFDSTGELKKERGIDIISPKVEPLQAEEKLPVIIPPKVEEKPKEEIKVEPPKMKEKSPAILEPPSEEGEKYSEPEVVQPPESPIGENEPEIWEDGKPIWKKDNPDYIHLEDYRKK